MGLCIDLIMDRWDVIRGTWASGMGSVGHGKVEWGPWGMGRWDGVRGAWAGGMGSVGHGQGVWGPWGCPGKSLSLSVTPV
jgi:hypothetical protein